MSKSVKILFYFLFLSLALSNCRDKELDEFYARPESLAAPIYQQLEAKGDFKNFLNCIDKAGYKNTLSKAGYFTIFAPNDKAFSKFFNENGLGGVDEVDTATAKKIVSYALVYNAFTRDRLADYQSPSGWMSNSAYKRRTAYYVGVYNDFDNSLNNFGKPILATASNRNGSTFYKGTAVQISIDNNNKHIPYFIDRYFTANNLTADDYNYFYPSKFYTGFNVAGASVLQADIFAENGYIHVVDEVTMPIPSIEEYVKFKPDYSKFWNLLQKNEYSYFLLEPEVTKRYKVLTGSSDPVYVKYYSASLGFSPNNENFKKEAGADNDAQTSGWTLFMPNNEAFDEYINKVLLEHHPILDSLPDEVILDFINAHMWQNTVWPSKFYNVDNMLGEEARFDPAINIVESKFLSNGIFYGTNKPQEANVFHTVFGRPYLDPKYSMMTTLLKRELKQAVTQPSVKYTIFMMSDEALKRAGYTYNKAAGKFYLNGIESGADGFLKRLLDLHVVLTPNGELDNLAGNNIVETFGGEYIKFSANTVFAAGNVENSNVATVSKTLDMTNGKVHYLDDILQFPTQSVFMKIRELGDKAVKPYNMFYTYLKNSNVINGQADTSKITIKGIPSGSFNTIFIPTNAAVSEAIANGLLPASPTSAVQSDKDLVAAFINYHILPRTTMVPDGNKEGKYEALYKTLGDEQKYFIITNTPNDLGITDYKNRTAKVLMSANSNVLSDRAVIHQIDTYLDYRK